MAAAASPHQTAPHTPVLLRPLLDAVAPVSGVWLDGTFGAGGYTRGLIEADRFLVGIMKFPFQGEYRFLFFGGCCTGDTQKKGESEE